MAAGGSALGPGALSVRWLGKVRYRDAAALQRGLYEYGRGDHLLLLEHPPVYTLGLRADERHILRPPHEVGAEFERADRGGDVTFHGPGQLVAYPILSLPGKGGGDLPDTPRYVHRLEQVVIDTLTSLGLTDVGRMEDYPGVWVEPAGGRPRKICAIGVRIGRNGRTLNGIGLNVRTDLEWFSHIVPCGIPEFGVTSLAAEGVDVSMREVVDRFAGVFADAFAPGRPVDRADVAWRVERADLAPFTRGEGPGEVTGGSNLTATQRRALTPDAAPTAEVAGTQTDGTSVRLLGRLAEAGVSGGLPVAERKPDWLRARVHHGPDVLRLKSTIRDLGLVTVCEEAGCPNLSECWADGTATFMVNGERCTRACGFCLVDTRRPEAPEQDEPERVAEAVERMDLAFAVVTTVARDDLEDEGAGHVAATIRAIRARRPATQVEVLISDCRGRPEALQVIFDARPDVLNHNLETVARLQRAVRPSASYSRSLAVLARAKAGGLTTKSGLIVGMGETDEEVRQALWDLASVGCDIVTIGQYLRPTSHHLPVARWVEPSTFEAYKAFGESMGIGHVESSPHTRSSYHAREAAAPVTDAPPRPVTSPGTNPVAGGVA